MNKIKQMFLGFVKGRGLPSAALTAIVIALVVFVNIIIYALSSVLPLYIHSEKEQDFSISGATDALFNDAILGGREVTVTFCSYEDVVSSHSTGAFVYDTAKQFAERYPDFIKLRFVNVYTMLDSDGNSISEELAKYEADEDVRINSTSVIFSTENGYRVLTDTYTSAGYADFYTLNESSAVTSYNGEEVFAASVMAALRREQGKAYFTAGHGETANMIMQTILNSAGYEVEQIDLRKKDVPEDAQLLFISNPIADFERGAEGSSLVTEYDRLKAYAERGGNFFVIFNCYAKELPTLESFVSEFGITYRKNDDGAKAIIKENSNAITADGFTFVAEYAEETIPADMKEKIVSLTEGNGNVIMREVVALDLSGNAKPLLVSSSTSVLQANGETIDREGNYVVSAYSTAKNDYAEDAKLFFMFDGNVTATDAIVTNAYSNRDFLYSLFDVFYGKDDMPYGCRSVLFNDLKLENLTMGTAKVYTAILLAIPAALAAVGTVVIVRRKNR